MKSLWNVGFQEKKEILQSSVLEYKKVEKQKHLQKKANFLFLAWAALFVFKFIPVAAGQRSTWIY